MQVYLLELRLIKKTHTASIDTEVDDYFGIDSDVDDDDDIDTEVDDACDTDSDVDEDDGNDAKLDDACGTDSDVVEDDSINSVVDDARGINSEVDDDDDRRETVSSLSLTSISSLFIRCNFFSLNCCRHTHDNLSSSDSINSRVSLYFTISFN